MLSIKYKFPLILLLVIGLFAGASAWISEEIIMPPFQRMDEEQAAKNLQRSINALLDEVDDLEKTTLDWAYWDDAYEYVQDPNPDFESSNLIQSTYDNVHIDLMVFINQFDELVWGGFRNRDPDTGEVFLKPVVLQNQVLELGQYQLDLSTLRKKNGLFSGIYVADSLALLFATSPISDSEGVMPERGRLIMASFLTGSRLREMQVKTEVDFLMAPLFGVSQNPQDVELVQRLAQAQQSALIDEGDHIRAHGVIAGVNGKYLLVSTDTQQSLVALGRELVNEVIGWLLGGGTIIFLSSVILIRIFVLDPILKVERFVKQVHDTENYDLRMDSHARDEVGSLANCVSSFVAKLSSTLNELNRLNQVQNSELAYRRDLEEHLQKANEKLKLLASQDGLTGLANRRIFDENLVAEWHRLLRHKRYLTLALLDIDFFKQYNDTYGHAEGDDCLVAVACALRSRFKRASDTVARYGGEEFAIILPECTPEDAMRMGEDIVEAVIGIQRPHVKSEFGVVSASVGVCTVMPDECFDVEDLLRQADENLYKAKATGRNQSWFTVLRVADNPMLHSSHCPQDDNRWHS